MHKPTLKIYQVHCVCLCVYVCAPVYLCRSQSLKMNVFFYWSPPYFFETRSLAEPGVGSPSLAGQWTLGITLSLSPCDREHSRSCFLCGGLWSELMLVWRVLRRLNNCLRSYYPYFGDGETEASMMRQFKMAQLVSGRRKSGSLDTWPQSPHSYRLCFTVLPHLLSLPNPLLALDGGIWHKLKISSGQNFYGILMLPPSGVKN